MNHRFLETTFYEFYVKIQTLSSGVHLNNTNYETERMSPYFSSHRTLEAVTV